MIIEVINYVEKDRVFKLNSYLTLPRVTHGGQQRILWSGPHILPTQRTKMSVKNNMKEEIENFSDYRFGLQFQWGCPS